MNATITPATILMSIFNLPFPSKDNTTYITIEPAITAMNLCIIKPPLKINNF